MGKKQKGELTEEVGSPSRNLKDYGFKSEEKRKRPILPDTEDEETDSAARKLLRKKMNMDLDEQDHDPPEIDETTVASSQNEKHDLNQDNDVDSGAEDEKRNENVSIPPRLMYEYCEKLLKMESSQKIIGKKKCSSSFEPILRDAKLGQVDPKDFQNVFRAYYKHASALTAAPIIEALKLVMSYTQDETSVKMYPDYPKQPTPAFKIYSRKRGCQTLMPPKDIGDDFRKGVDPLIEVAQQEAKQERLEHIKNLRKFLVKNRSSLFPVQIRFVEKKIKHMDNAENPPPPIEKALKQQKKEKPKLTAFDFYKNSKKHKYTDLEENLREDKLMRHFNKLTPDKREIYDDLARNQDT
ncbi:acyl-CoA thioesterase II [Ditylenchus destructor]|nr:acyl-CoA thioesterase II [Ditylenchus destructor]